MLTGLASTIMAIAISGLAGQSINAGPNEASPMTLAQGKPKYKAWTEWPEEKEKKDQQGKTSTTTPPAPATETKPAPAPVYQAPAPAPSPAPAPAPSPTPGYQSTEPAPSVNEYPSIYDRPEPKEEPRSFYPWRDTERQTQAKDEFEGPNGAYEWVEARAGLWYTGFGAQVKSTSGALEGTDIDLSDQLGLGQSKMVLYFEGVFRASDNVKLWVEKFNVNYGASKRLTEELVFKGQVYKVNTPVDSSISLDSIRLGLTVDLFNGDAGSFGIGLAGDFVSNTTSLTALNLVKSQADIKIVVPMVTTSIRVYPFWMMGLGLDAGWIGYEKSSMYDISFFADVNPIPYVGASVGWKGIMLDIQSGGDSVNMKWSGLFAKVAVRF